MRTALVACILTLTATALADPRQDARLHAEQLEKVAKESHDFAAYVAAGDADMALYNADPDDASNDETLYNAAVSYESGASDGAAITAYTLLLRQYPNGKLAAHALARLGKLYGDIAMYDRAAEKLEQYAKKYAGEKDAFDAMSDATYYRKAIGDREKAIEDTKYFINTFGAKKPREAADAMWSLSDLYASDPDAVIKHLRAYLHQFGLKGGADRLVIANAQIGQLLWKQSCPVRGVYGLCVKASSVRKTCGPATAIKLTPVKRDEKLVKEALTAFAAAIKEYEQQPPAGDTNARYDYAQAQIATADLDFEKYLAIAFPTNLDFSAPKLRKSSAKRFDEWLEDKQKAAGHLREAYERTLQVKDAASSIAAAERIGMVVQVFASTMLTAEIPNDVKRGPMADEKAKAYCDALTVAAEPLEANAKSAFEVCLVKSTELAWWSDSSTHCERELAHSEPETFPQLSELRGAALSTSVVLATEPPPRSSVP